MVFHERLIQRRKELGLTQEELADKLEVSRQSISKWENGDSMPDADKLIKLSDTLGLSLDDLTGREVKVEPIVLRAPDVPKPHGKQPWRIVLTVAAVVLIVAALVVAGIAVIRCAGTEPDAAASRLPDELRVSGLAIQYAEGVMTCSFTANTDLDGTLYLYTQNAQQPVSFDAVYADGIHTASAQISPNTFDQLVFTVREGETERIALLAVNVSLDHTDEGWSNSWAEP